MNRGYIDEKLIQAGISNYTIENVSLRIKKIIISGIVHVQAVKDIFNVIKWEYDNNKVVFTIQE